MSPQLPNMQIFLLVWILSLSAIRAAEINFDMETSRVCNTITPTILTQYDVANIYARPVLSGPATRDICTVKFVGEEGRKLKFTLVDLVYGECQIFVKVYDGGTANLNTERFSFGCRDSAGGLYYSNNNDIAISLQKPDPNSKNYKFYIRLATEDGPNIGGESGENIPSSDGISIGIIVGIAVGSFLAVAVVVGIVVYCFVIQRRKSEEKHDQSVSMFFTGTGTSTGKTGTSRGDGSVHSSKHDSVDNPNFRYPAYRSAGSIKEKAPKCESLPSHSQETLDENETKCPRQNGKSSRAKSSEEELKSMRKGIERYEEKKEQQETLKRRRAKEAQRAAQQQEQSRRHRSSSTGRTARIHNRPMLTEDNVRRSVRERSRSLDRDNQNRSSSHHGSTRSSRHHGSRARAHSPSRSGTSSRTPHYESDYDYRGRRDVKQSNVHRSSSTNSRSRKRQDSDNDERERSRDRGTRNRDKNDRYYDRDRNDRYYDSDHGSARSGGHRPRASSTGRRR